MRQLKITQSITNRESTALEKYLQDISHEGLISVEEEIELARKIKTGRCKSTRKTNEGKLTLCGICCKTVSKSRLIAS